MAEKVVEIISTNTYPFRIWSGCAAEVLGDVNADIIAPNTDSESDSEEEEDNTKNKKKSAKYETSDDEENVKSKKSIKKKKKKNNDTDSEDDVPKKKSVNKKKNSDTDSEDDVPKKKSVNKKKNNDTDSEDDVPKKKSVNKKKNSDTDSEDDIPKKKSVNKKKNNDTDSEDDVPKKKSVNKKKNNSEDDVPKKKVVKKKNNDSDSDSEDDVPKKKSVNKKKVSSENKLSKKKSTDKGLTKKKLVNKGNSKSKVKEKNIVKVHDTEIEVTPKKKKGRPKKSDQSSKFKYEENVDEAKAAETNSSGGIKIIAVNPAKTVLVYTHLPAKNFEKFKCKKKKITIGLNLPNFHKFIKTMAKESTLTLFMEEDDMNQLGIRVDNSNKNRVSNFKLNLLDLEKVDLEFERAEYESYIRMPAEDFKQTCKNMQNIADLVEIKNVDKQLSFMCEGEIGVHEEIYGQQDKGMKVNNDADIVQGVFEIKYLVQFSKCAPLCDNIELYMRNDYPLIIKFSIPTLGEVYFCQSPVLDNKKNDEDVLDDKDKELSDISDDD
jgi:proliferating cell nuclear antigen